MASAWPLRASRSEPLGARLEVGPDDRLEHELEGRLDETTRSRTVGIPR